MSLPLMAAAWASGLPPIDRLVLLALADWANERAQCWPSMPTIAKKTGVDLRTARRVVARLEAAGHLATERRPGKGILYTVHPGHADPGHSDPGQAVPRTESTLTPDTLPPNTLRTTSKKKETSSLPSTRASKLMPPAPAGVSSQHWSDFVEMRERMAKGPKGRPWTPGAARAAIDKLQELEAAGENPDAVLAQSVLNGWQGLFPVKQERGRFRDPLLNAEQGRAFWDKPSGPVEGRRRIRAQSAVDTDRADDTDIPF